MSNRKRKFLSLAIVIVLGLTLLTGAALAHADFTNIARAAETEPVAETNEVDLSNTDVLHWTVEGSVSGSSSNLLSGRVYVYRYKADSDASSYSEYYSFTRKSESPNPAWTEWELINSFDVKSSIMRFRGDGVEHKIEIQSAHLGTKFSVEYETETPYTQIATAQGTYRAQAKFTAIGEYTFKNDENFSRDTLDERGITLNISPDGKTATMTKIWYVANYDNALLDSEASKTSQAEVEYFIPSWQFGEYQTIEYPWLHHGDEALRGDLNLPSTYSVSAKVSGDEYEQITEEINMESRSRAIDLKSVWDPRSSDQKYDVVTFSLTRINDDGKYELITPRDETVIRSQWSYYINQYTPAGNYELTIHVKDIKLTSHTHWWDETEHTILDSAEAEFKGFDVTYNFTVAPGELTITNASEVQNDKSFQLVNIDELKSNYNKFFRFGDEFIFEYKMKMSEMENDTFWTSDDNINTYFEAAPHLEYNLNIMDNNGYQAKNWSDWKNYITSPATYTVYYMAVMKNYSTFPLISDRYENKYEVIVYKDVPLPGLNLTEMTYTGGELSVAPKEAESVASDMSLYTWTGNTATEAGDHIVTFTLNDNVHYKWDGTNDKGLKFDFGDTYEIKWTINKAKVSLPQIVERNFAPNKTFEPTITVPKDVKGRAIFTFQSAQYDEAGTYDIELTLRDDNFVWEYTAHDAESGATIDKNNSLKATVKFVIAPEQNMWIVSPRIPSWEWGEYDKNKNAIEGAAMRGDVKFSISYDSKGNRMVDGLSDIALVGGVVDEATAEKIGALNRGDYYLLAKVDESKNYTGIKSTAYKFSIDEATNYWDNTPNIVIWKYEDYNPDINLITATPHFIADGASVKFSIVTDKTGNVDNDYVIYGLENLNVVNGVVQGDARELLDKLEGNRTYWLRAVVDSGYSMVGSQKVYNYSPLITYTEFHILQSDNYWVETPNIHRWVEGEDAELPIGSSKWGEPTFKIYRYDTNSDGDRVKGEKLYDSKEGLNKLDEAKPGMHLLEAAVEGNANYTSLTSSLEFKVFSTNVNFWRKVPNIQSWVVGSAPNAPVATAAFGTVYYSYYDRADYALNGAYAQKLSGVPVSAGRYVLLATAVYPELDDLVAAVEFTIYEQDTNTVYYAVIGVLAGIILLGLELVIMFAVLKNRKRLKLIASEGGGVATDAADDEDLGMEFEEEFEEEEAVAEDISDDDEDAEIIAEPVDADAPAIEPTAID
ncbi:MAG: hypothetical protein NC179_03505 [[Eubacterium] siraeum]|nr:hypothetical protein [[Eubacterium] siraeum]